MTVLENKGNTKLVNEKGYLVAYYNNESINLYYSIYYDTQGADHIVSWNTGNKRLTPYGSNYNFHAEVVNGKGMFSKRTISEGLKKYGGLIKMKTETGTKIYPFNGEYLVAAKTAVVSPTNMNILYLEVDNPLKISVPGYTAGEISAVINNGKVSAIKKSLGEYTARPSKKGKAIVSLFANVDGKRTKMGDMEFRVKEVPEPDAAVRFSTNVKGELFIDKMKMITAGGLSAKL